MLCFIRTIVCVCVRNFYGYVVVCVCANLQDVWIVCVCAILYSMCRKNFTGLCVGFYCMCISTKIFKAGIICVCVLVKLYRGGVLVGSYVLDAF